MIFFLNFQSFFSERCKKYGCRGDLEIWGREHGGAFPCILTAPCLHTPDQARTTCNRQREKELLEDLSHPKPRDQKTCDLTLEIFWANPPYPSQTPRKPHLACLQCRLEWEAPEPTGVVWGQVLALTGNMAVARSVHTVECSSVCLAPVFFSPNKLQASSHFSCKTSR